MTEFITSDIHFGHKNILTYCAKTRPYASIDEMDRAIIRDWNRIVSPGDTVYILGDVSYHTAERTASILWELNGDKILIIGNHDESLMKHQVFRDCFKEIHHYLEIKRNKRKIVLFHFPISEWNKAGKGSLHFHGHLHGDSSGLEEYRIMDVGMDATGSVVIPLEKAIEHALTGKHKHHHGD